MTVAEALQAEQLYVEAGSIKEARKIRCAHSGEVHCSMTCLVFGLFGATLGAQPAIGPVTSFAFVLTLGIIRVLLIGFSFSSLGVRARSPPWQRGFLC